RESHTIAVLKYRKVNDDRAFRQVPDPLEQCLHRQPCKISHWNSVFIGTELLPGHCLPGPVEICTSGDDSDLTRVGLQQQSEVERFDEIVLADDAGRARRKLVLLQIICPDSGKDERNSRDQLIPSALQEIERLRANSNREIEVKPSIFGREECRHPLLLCGSL